MCGAAEPARRIHANIDESRTFQLEGNTRGAVARAQDQGEVDGSLGLTGMTMHFAMTAAQNADLQQLLKAQVTRKSSQYHKWLTPEEFGARFGVNSSDIEKVTLWLEGQGFTNIEAARSRNAISFSGNAAQVKSAFRMPIHHYAINGQTHFANATNPALPEALQGFVAGIRGLNDLHPKPRVRVRPHFTSGITLNHFLTPGDFATIYDVTPLYAGGFDGTGQKIVVPGQSDIALADIAAFRTAAGLTANVPQVVLVGTDPGTSADDASESDLDIEWSGGVAKNATIIFVNSTDIFTSMTYAIQNNLAPIVSVTYGLCEAQLGTAEGNTLNAVFQQGNAQGITIVAASGDDGAADCDGSDATGTTVASQGLAVDFPSSSPYVTGLGGTTFNEGSGTYWNSNGTSDVISSATSYIPETAWNDTASDGTFSASGGGASLLFTKPSWQAGTGVPNDGARDTPDISFSASPDHDGYLICSAGSCVTGFRDASSNLNVIGGTSAAAPTFAGIVALLNQQQGSLQGNVNPILYSIASFSTDAFHDITSGNNMVPCRTGTTECPVSGELGFTTGTGYDQVTGLGSLDAYNLVTQWTGDFGVAVDPSTLSVARGASGSATVIVTKEGNFAGTVSFSCTVSNALTNTTCSVPGTVAGSGSVTLTVTTGATAAAPLWRRSAPIEPIALGGLILLSIFYWMGDRKPARLFAPALALALMVVVTSCGNGSASTTTTSNISPTTETGLVTVIATSGTLSNSATVNVTVP